MIMSLRFIFSTVYIQQNNRKFSARDMVFCSINTICSILWSLLYLTNFNVINKIISVRIFSVLHISFFWQKNKYLLLPPWLKTVNKILSIQKHRHKFRRNLPPDSIQCKLHFADINLYSGGSLIPNSEIYFYCELVSTGYIYRREHINIYIYITAFNFLTFC